MILSSALPLRADYEYLGTDENGLDTYQMPPMVVTPGNDDDFDWPDIDIPDWPDYDPFGGGYGGGGGGGNNLGSAPNSSVNDCAAAGIQNALAKLGVSVTREVILQVLAQKLGMTVQELKDNGIPANTPEDIAKYQKAMAETISQLANKSVYSSIQPTMSALADSIKSSLAAIVAGEILDSITNQVKSGHVVSVTYDSQTNSYTVENLDGSGNDKTYSASEFESGVLYYNQLTLTGYESLKFRISTNLPVFRVAN